MLKIRNNEADIVTAFNQNFNNVNYLNLFSYNILKTNINNISINKVKYFNIITKAEVVKEAQDIAISLSSAEIKYLVLNLENDNYLLKNEEDINKSVEVILYKVQNNNNNLQIEDLRQFFKVTPLLKEENGANPLLETEIENIKREIEELKKYEPEPSNPDNNNSGSGITIFNQENGLRELLKRDDVFLLKNYVNTTNILYFKNFTFFNNYKNEFSDVNNSYVNIYNNKTYYIYYNLATNQIDVRETTKETDVNLLKFKILLYKVVKTTEITNVERLLTDEDNNHCLNFIDFLNEQQKDLNNFSLNLRKSVNTTSYVYFKNFSFYNHYKKEVEELYNSYITVNNNKTVYVYYNLAVKQFETFETKINDVNLLKFKYLLYKIDRKNFYNVNILNSYVKDEEENINCLNFIQQLDANEKDLNNFSLNLRKSVNTTSYVYFKNFSFYNHYKKEVEELYNSYITVNNNKTVYVYYNLAVKQFETFETKINDVNLLKFKYLLYKIDRKNFYNVNILNSYVKDEEENINCLNFIQQLDANEKDLNNFSLNLRKSVNTTSYVYFKNFTFFNNYKNNDTNVNNGYITVNNNKTVYVYYNLTNNVFETRDNELTDTTNKLKLYKITRSNFYNLSVEDFRNV